jgi:hypothetical protein
MKNFKILSIAALVSVSTFSFAASETFQATVNAVADATIANTTPLHFGAMQTATGSVCTMDNAGAVTGACDASNANIALGVVTVSGLLANTALDVTVNGSSGSNVTFVSTVDIQNAAGTHNAVSDNTTTAVTTNGSGDDLAINVYGTMTVDSDLTAGQAYTADYVVDVTFQ